MNKNTKFDIDILKNMLINKFSQINYTDAKEDVLPFIEDINSLNLWQEDFFVDITKNLKQVKTYGAP